jgi:hypothetical protein
MKLIKLTDKDNQTRNRTQWGVNVTHELPETGNPELCSSSVLHAYKSMNQALLMWPVHGINREFNIWEAEGEVVVEDATKVGVFSLTTNRMLQPPEWYKNNTTRNRVQIKFAILCAKAVLHIFEDKFPSDTRPREAIEAAESWLKGADAAAAYAAYADTAAAAAAAAADTAYAAYDAAYDAAARAAYAAYDDAARAAYDAAARAARATYAAYDAAYDTAYAAADAAYAAADAARAAARAARAADYDARAAELDLVKLADEAIDYVENEINNQA